MRYSLLDFLKGFWIINVVLFHYLYDIYVLTGADVDWPFGFWVSLWQETGLSMLIALAGMSAGIMGQHKRWRNGAKLTAMGLLISMGTIAFMPEEQILYGVLTFFGTALLLTVLLESGGLLSRLAPEMGMALCIAGYAASFRIDEVVVDSDAFAIFGLHSDRFYSADYVPLLPYIFMFWLGLYILPFLKQHASGVLSWGRCRPLELCGRHSLLIYIVHQPILLAMLRLLGII